MYQPQKHKCLSQEPTYMSQAHMYMSPKQMSMPWKHPYMSQKHMYVSQKNMSMSLLVVGSPLARSVVRGPIEARDPVGASNPRRSHLLEDQDLEHAALWEPSRRSGPGSLNISASQTDSNSNGPLKLTLWPGLCFLHCDMILFAILYLLCMLSTRAYLWL